jgi:uncharacterized membrane protein
MENLSGFLRWQLDQFRNISWNFIAYVAMMSLVFAGVFMDPATAPVLMGVTLDIWLVGLGGVAWLVWIAALLITMQYQEYCHERRRIMQELERKQS